MTKNIKVFLVSILGLFLSINLFANNISKDMLPNSFELVGKDKEVAKDELFKPNTKNLIVVGNHDSLAVVKELGNYFELKTPFVMVANIASAPWFVKKMFIPGKLEELVVGSSIPMIYDFDGDTVKALKVTDNSKTVLIAYILDENNNISKVYEGHVKEGALDGSMTEEEKKAALQPLFDIVNQ